MGALETAFNVHVAPAKESSSKQQLSPEFALSVQSFYKAL
jgi:hypothetical protein